MGLEVATFISGLNANNPVGATDPKSQGDDHLRLIKSTLLNTFPSITGAMNASHTELNNLVGITGKTGTGNLVLSASPTLSGTISGGTFSGDGSLLTALNASNLLTGSIPDARVVVSNVTQHVGSIDHDSLLNFVSNEHVDHSLISINAGGGLTGGGTIAANRTLAVGAGSGISVSANAVAVDNTVIRTTGAQTIGGTKTFTSDISMSGTRAIDATTRLNLTGAAVSVGESGGNLGFFGSGGVGIRTISGTLESDGSNPGATATVLNSLISSLALYGVIIDSVTLNP